MGVVGMSGSFSWFLSSILLSATCPSRTRSPPDFSLFFCLVHGLQPFLGRPRFWRCSSSIAPLFATLLVRSRSVCMGYSAREVGTLPPRRRRTSQSPNTITSMSDNDIGPRNAQQPPPPAESAFRSANTTAHIAVPQSRGRRLPLPPPSPPPPFPLKRRRVLSAPRAGRGEEGAPSTTPGHRLLAAAPPPPRRSRERWWSAGTTPSGGNNRHPCCRSREPLPPEPRGIGLVKRRRRLHAERPRRQRAGVP